eukprot:124272-Chlamydomonas_euryale.AAC.1
MPLQHVPTARSPPPSPQPGAASSSPNHTAVSWSYCVAVGFECTATFWVSVQPYACTSRTANSTTGAARSRTPVTVAVRRPCAAAAAAAGTPPPGCCAVGGGGGGGGPGVGGGGGVLGLEPPACISCGGGAAATVAGPAADVPPAAAAARGGPALLAASETLATSSRGARLYSSGCPVADVSSSLTSTCINEMPVSAWLATMAALASEMNCTGEASKREVGRSTREGLWGEGLRGEGLQGEELQGKGVGRLRVRSRPQTGCVGGEGAKVVEVGAGAGVPGSRLFMPSAALALGVFCTRSGWSGRGGRRSGG